MCGISGIINFNNKPVLESDLTLMMNKMRHRGPDDQGVYLDRNIGLSFVRLSILDLTPAGHQPMHSFNDRYVIVFNGEIYNYIELKSELQDKYNFKSNTDTEVLLNAYIEWGEKCLDKLNGMFAFVIYDKQTRKIFGSRDRFGIKPFYYYYNYKSFIFASDIPSILSVLNCDIEPDDSSIFDYLAFGRTDQNANTFFRQVKKLQHGCSFSITGVNLKIKKWYNLKDKKVSPITDIADFRALLKSSIDLRMRSDVPVGVSLSGGVDSSSLVGIVSKDLGFSDLYTFSSVYNIDHRANEKSSIDLVKLKNSKFVNPSITDLIDDIKDFLDAHSEPFSTSAIFAQYKVMELARNDVTVLLDGQGADEYLAGYPYFHGYYYSGLLRTLKLRKLFKEIVQYSKKSKNTENLKYFAYFCSPSYVKKRIAGSNKSYIRREFFNRYVNDSSILGGLYESKNLTESILNHFEHKLEHLLKWEDRNSMHFSIESRVPFLDYRLVEQGINMPDNLKIRNGMTKYVLRECVRDIVPAQILDNTYKVGYATPEDIWFRNIKFKKFIYSLLKEGKPLSEPYVVSHHFENVLNNHLTGKTNASSEIWRWVNLELWMRKYFI